MGKPATHHLVTTLVMWLVFTGCLFWLFYPGLINSQVPAFRDAYHFYYPQAVWLQQCAQQGSYFPSWNPAEGLGVSLAGQPSAALYYPLRWLWWLPALSVAQKFSLVIVVHMLIAAAGMKRAARKLGCTGDATWLAAISFSLSCPVFFQHTNLIYLCSAAWIGFGLAAVLDVLQSTSLRQYLSSCIVFSCVASLMLLAGDPQTAANTFIVSSLIFVAEWLPRRLRKSNPALTAAVLPPESAGTGSGQAATAGRHSIGGQVLWLVGALGLAVLLGCVQWLPAWRWANHSSRLPGIVEIDAKPVRPSTAHVSANPSSTPSAELLSAVGDAMPSTVVSATPAVDAVLRDSRPVASRSYDFSLSPWHMLTCLWPTLGGHYLPSNSRWFAFLPAEGRMWIPSLYFGCWPCLLFLLAVFGNQFRLARTLKIVALFALLAALGNYSIVWLVRELLSIVGLSTFAAYLPKDHVGSVIWMLNGLVPGYSMFRYPAKWTVWIVAAASLLAAQHFGSASSLQRITFRRSRLSLLALSLSGLAVSGCLALAVGVGYSFDVWLAAVTLDPWLGPPNTSAIVTSLVIAFAVPSAILGLNTFSCPSLRNRRIAKFARLLPSLTLITLAEMTLCASCWTCFLAAPSFDSDRLSFAQSHSHTNQLERPFVWSNRGLASLQRDHFVRSPQSYAQDQATYQHTWMLGKLGLLADVKCLHATQSIDPFELAQLRRWLGRHDRQVPHQPEVDRVLGELGVTHRLLRGLPTSDSFSAEQAAQPTEFTWQAIRDPAPLCQVLDGRAEATGADNSVSYRWVSPAHLVIEIDGAHAEPLGERVLIVRQMNDGGWIARDGTGRSLDIRGQRLFVEVELFDAVGDVTLCRKWFW